MSQPPIAIIMGSDSDIHIMKDAVEVIESFGVTFHIEVVSAHRTPQGMISFAKKAAENGFKVIIAGAGGAAHLPGMVASATTLPVIGVPVKLKHLHGLDSLLSIVQMPKGIPVATVAIDNAGNAGLLALRILGIENLKIQKKLRLHQKNMEKKVKTSNKNLKTKLKDFLKDN